MTEDKASHPSPGPEPPPPEREEAAGHASLPTPVRKSLASPEPPEAVPGGGHPPAENHAGVALDGRDWTVRVVGRSTGGPPSAPVPLLLLGFFSGPGDERPEREALVVGRGLDELTPHRLEAAYRASQAPPPEGARKPFFAEIASKGDRRDG